MLPLQKMKRIHYLTTLILAFKVVTGINNKIFTGTNNTKIFVTGVNTTHNRGTIRFQVDIPENDEKYHDILVLAPPHEETVKENPARSITDEDRRTIKSSEPTDKIKDFGQSIPPKPATEASAPNSKPLSLYLANPTEIEEVKEINGNLGDEATTAESTSPFGASNLDVNDFFEPSETDVFADSAPRVAFHGDQKKRINFQDNQKEILPHSDLTIPDNQKQRLENQLIFEDNQKDRLQQQFTFQDDDKERQPHQLIFEDDQKERPQHHWIFDEETDKGPQNQLSFQDDRNNRKQKKFTFQNDKNLSPAYQLTSLEDNQSPSHHLIFQEDQNQRPHYQLTFQEDDNKKQSQQLTFQEDQNQRPPYQLTLQEDQNQRPQFQQTQFVEVPVAQHQPIPGQIPVQTSGQKVPQRKRRRKNRQYFHGMEGQTKPLMVVQDVLSMLLQNDMKKCMLKLFCDQAHELSSQPQNAANSLRGAIDSVLYITKMLPILTQKFGDNIGKLGSAMAAFMEAASTGRTSGLHGCRKAYPDCPSDTVEMANYIATFNGGFTRLFNGENYTYNSFNMHQELGSNQVGLAPEYSGQYGFEPLKLPPGQYYPKIPPVSPQYVYPSSNYHLGYQPNYQQSYQPQGYQPNHQQSYQSQGYQPNHQQSYQPQGYQPNHQQSYQSQVYQPIHQQSYHHHPNHKPGSQPEYQQDYFNHQGAKNG